MWTEPDFSRSRLLLRSFAGFSAEVLTYERDVTFPVPTVRSDCSEEGLVGAVWGGGAAAS